VNVGPRQEGRDRGSNVIDVGYARGEIAGAIRRQVEHGRYESEQIYGDGSAGRQIAEILAKRELTIRKRMTY
jgi:UDP-N-acetylglucosamine 2-epimerase